jgi:hypothetical protein
MLSLWFKFIFSVAIIEKSEQIFSHSPMQLGAEINHFSLMMVAPHASFPSNIKDTTVWLLALGCVGTSHDAVLAVISMDFYFNGDARLDSVLLKF